MQLQLRTLHKGFVQNSLQQFKHKMTGLKLKKFQPKLQFVFDFRNYRVKTAHTTKELKEVLKLRYKVFKSEDINDIAYDFDRYDLLGDHILLIDKTENKIIGTYRLLSSQFTNEFYSENEFELTELLEQDKNFLELGRACIHPDHRNGITINLIWKGLGRYINLSQADYVFGCSSLFNPDIKLVTQTKSYLQNYHSLKEVDVYPQPDYWYHLKQSSLSDEQEKQVENTLPPLLRSYIHAGAKVCATPAFDVEFNCFDFFTILKIADMTPKFKKRFLQEQ